MRRVMASTLARSRASVGSRMAWLTRMRVLATQVWPLAMKLAKAMPLTAASRWASAKTTRGALPPSSAVNRARLAPTRLPMARPAAVPPVMSVLRTSGCETSAAPVSVPRPGSTEKTPSGTPACCSRRPSSSVVRGVSSLGLTMTLLPAARAGAIFLTAISSGWLNEVSCTTTPSGTRVTKLCSLPDVGSTGCSSTRRTAA